MPASPRTSSPILDGLQAEFPNATITFVPGTQFLRTDGKPVPDALLTTPDGKPGLKAEYNEGRRGLAEFEDHADRDAHRNERQADREQPCPRKSPGRKHFGVQWTGFLTPTESGDFLLGVRCQGFCRLTVDGKQVASAFGGGDEMSLRYGPRSP